jgi:hypothetical protein
LTSFPCSQGDYVLPSGVLGFEHLDIVPHKVWDVQQ